MGSPPGPGRGWPLVLAAGLLAAGGGACGERAGGGAPALLLPDLVVGGPSDLSIETTADGRRLLRFQVDAVNVGPGPVEVRPVAGDDCDGDGDVEGDRSLVQVVFADGDGDGRFDPEADPPARERRAGCSRFHAGHTHWHADNFASYALAGAQGGPEVARADKVTFCLHDVRRVGAGPGVPAEERYADCRSDVTQGLSPGWSDDYYAELEGQSLDVTGVPDGDYCLVVVVNAAGLIEESDLTNNGSVVGLRLRGGTVALLAAGDATRPPCPSFPAAATARPAR